MHAAKENNAVVMAFPEEPEVVMIRQIKYSSAGMSTVAWR